MTSEKAIKFFEKQHKSPAYFISLDEWRDYNDALDMAINALGAINLKDLGYSLGEKPRTDGGMVSRQTVLETVESELIGNLGITEQVIAENIVNDVCVKIRQLPSAEPKTGRWLETEGLDEEIRCLMCTNPMRSDRGCDGSCQYNEHMYKKIMSALKRRMMEVEHGKAD